jgi:4-amino-4-deoxy-L-arabinose transferase-like glycosyltransferase
LAVVLAGGLLLGLAWLAALSPPLFYDALHYHLALPNLFLLRGKIEALPSVVTSYYPLGPQMLFLLGFFLEGPTLASLVNFLFACLSLVALSALALRCRSRWAALAAPVLYLSLPMAFWLSRYATTEHPLAFFFLLEVLCLLAWREEGGRGWLLLAGLLGGFAAAAKYVGALFSVILPGLLLLGPLGPPRGERRRLASSLLLFAGAAALPLFPWLAKNAAWAGNPLYPALGGLFGGESLDPARARLLAGDAHAAWVLAGSWRDFARLPWDLVAGGGRDLGAASVTTWAWPLGILAGIALWPRPSRRRERILLLLLAGSLLLWAGTFWMARFLLPAAGVAVLLLALTLARPGRRWGGWGGAAAVLVLAGINLAVILADAPTRRALGPALGAQRRQDYLASQLRSHRVAGYVNARLPPESRILVLGETRVAYLRRDHIFQTAYDRSVLEHSTGAPPEGWVGETLRRLGVTHILVNYPEMERLEGQYATYRGLAASLPQLNRLAGERGTLLVSDRGVSLFALGAGP